MNLKAIESAKALVQDRAERMEVMSIDGGGYALSVQFSGDGAQRVFYSLPEVQAWALERANWGAPDPMRLNLSLENLREVVQGAVSGSGLDDAQLDDLADELGMGLGERLMAAGVDFVRVYSQSVGAFAIVQAGSVGQREAFNKAMGEALAEVANVNAGAIEISVDGVWAGSGRIENSCIRDCPAVFCDDCDESEIIYSQIERAITSGQKWIKVEIDGATKVVSWSIE